MDIIDRTKEAPQTNESRFVDPEECELLPAWFTTRMMNDVWQFALVMKGKVIIPISHITNVCQDESGNLWVDAEVISKEDASFWLKDKFGSYEIFEMPSSRNQLTIQADEITMAFELADT
jgi:hypothetical protein